MPYVTPKFVLSSKTIRVNAVLLAIAGILASLPDTIQTPPLSNVVAMLPEHWRNVIAATISVIASVNMLLRLVTKTPVTTTAGS